jgi:hypothetical protein
MNNFLMNYDYDDNWASFIERLILLKPQVIILRKKSPRFLFGQINNLPNVTSEQSSLVEPTSIAYRLLEIQRDIIKGNLLNLFRL